MPTPNKKASENARYQALRSHDARFDGQFFVGVSSTGVYCRPVCRVKTPKQENCHFFDLAAQAEKAGYRPCLRCRPELSPGPLAWSIQDASHTLAQQAAQLLDHFHAWDTEAAWMEELSARLGVSERHVRRLFEQHWGISPLQYLQTRRLLCAKQLLTDTQLPVAQVALHSGFSSIRSFNAAFIKHYRLKPSGLRREGATGAAGVAGVAGNKTILLGYRPPYDFARLLGFFKAREIASIEAITHSTQELSIVKTLHIEHQKKSYSGWVRVQFQETQAQVALALSDSLTEVMPQVIQRVRSFLDLDADPAAIAHVLSVDFPGSQGLRLPGALDGFEIAVRAILGQQVSVAQACVLARRLVDRLGKPLTTPWTQLNRVFPCAKTLAAVNPSVLGEIGVFKQRQAAIMGLAQAVAAGQIDLHTPVHPQKSIDLLKQIEGIGDWTAQYIAMRALHWPDALPQGDVALQKALGLQAAKNPGAELARVAQKWQPWRSYAVIAAWAGNYQKS